MLCTLGVLKFVTSANAGTLFAATASGAAGELYTINPATGSLVQDIGPLNDSLNVNYPITGLAFNPLTGVLYGSTGNNVPAVAAKLVTINPLTGLVTVVGSFNAGNSGNPATMADLAFTPSGSLFGIGSVGGPQLYSINLGTGQATLVGDTGLTSTSGGGIAINGSGAIYGTPTATRFGTYDSGTGAYSNITNPTKPGGGSYAALAFDENGVLFGLNSGSGSPPPTHLVTLDTATGTITDLGASINSLDAIAFQPALVPEPGSVALLGLGISALLIQARRRR